MERHRLSVDERHCIIHAGLDNLIREDHAIAVAEIEKLDGLPSAFFCANDANAISLYRTLHAMKIRVPQDVSVMGFDDTDVSALVSPELTTMRVHKELMGRKAFLRLMEKTQDRTGVRERTLLSAELVERNSVIRKDLTKK
jgi:DNA-binding LacI/PurR family transcriptional regulator